MQHGKPCLQGCVRFEVVVGYQIGIRGEDLVEQRGRVLVGRASEERAGATPPDRGRDPPLAKRLGQVLAHLPIELREMRTRQGQIAHTRAGVGLPQIGHERRTIAVGGELCRGHRQRISLRGAGDRADERQEPRRWEASRRFLAQHAQVVSLRMPAARRARTRAEATSPGRDGGSSKSRRRMAVALLLAGRSARSCFGAAQGAGGIS